ncbi:hypothetical protein [Kutzneria sp. NPDC052558]|uniref:hypothetical protein n=1 Tax=Kutzneria sp. NPDC052558 TaxID=3364121 RepID=UPI0037C526CC
MFSAALIGHVEAAYRDEALKNSLTRPVPHPNLDTDWLRTGIATNRQLARWAAEPGMVEWLAGSRLMPLFSDAEAARAMMAMLPAMVSAENEALEKLLADA